MGLRWRLSKRRRHPQFRRDGASMPELELWDDLRLVKAIRDAHSLNGAAKILGLNHSTIFRRLVALEEKLGVRLFERGRDGYSATAAGAEMAALADRMAEDITEFERRVAGRDVEPSGQLRITTNDTILMHLLTPILASFRTVHAAISLDIIIGNEALNLSRRDADIAVRATDRPPETLVGRRIAGIAWAKYGPAPAHSRSDGSATAAWVGYGDNLSTVAALRGLYAATPADQIVYRVNTVLGAAEAIAAGIGCGFLPAFLGDRVPGIVRIGAAICDLGGSLWLLTHPDLRHAVRIRAFMDHVGSALLRQRKSIEGG
jgi:DNA-binding transcriptional LysR family regulator